MPRVNKWLVIALVLTAVVVTSAAWSWRIYRSTHFSFEGRLDQSKPADRLISLAIIEWRQIPEQEGPSEIFKPRAIAGSDIAFVLADMDDTDAAIEMAKVTDGNDIYAAYGYIAVKFADDGRDDDAKAMARLTAQGKGPNLWVWSSIVYAQARRGDFASAKASVESLQLSGDDDLDWMEIARGSCACRSFDAARDAIAAIQKPDRRVAALGVLACSQLDANDQDGARRSIALALAECPNIPERRRQFQAAAGLVEALARLGRTDEAREIISKYSKALSQDEIVRGLANAGKFDVALKLAGDGRSEDSYKYIASAQIKLGDFKSARATAGKIDLRSGLYVSAAKRADILGEIAQAELAVGDQAGALDDVRDAREILLGEPKDKWDKQLYHVNPRIFGKLVAIEIRAGIVDQAIDRIKDASTDPEFRSEAYAAAAKEVARK